MKRFENAQVGDRVYSRTDGKGVIASFDQYFDCPIQAQFQENRFNSFTLDGCLYSDAPEATLFYIDGDNLYAEKRPVAKVPWEKVPMDTKVFVSNHIGIYNIKRYFYHFKNNKFYCLMDGLTSWTSNGELHQWNYAMLAEDVTIDGVVYPKGSK